ncbi:MAG: membrane protein insertase YidC [Candidatus Cloacimonadales bacterium]|nr:membrane protein insertase YidC [Candidatus Cloacimonadales bacterium]
MDKRTILALLLILVVFWISSEFIWKRNQPVQPPQQNLTEQPQQIQQQKTTEPVQTPNLTEIIIPESEQNIAVNDEIILENEVIRLRFSNLGAVLKAVELKSFTLKDKEILVNLIPQNEEILGTKLALLSGNISNLNSVTFQYNQEEKGVVFTALTQFGAIEKSFHINGDYQLDMRIKIESENQLETYEIDFDSGIADTEEYLKMKSRDYKIVSQVDNILNKITLAKLMKSDQKLNGQVDWAAIKSKYFAMAIIPDDLIDVDKLTVFSNNDSPAMNLQVQTDRGMINHNYQLYLGPLVTENLVSYGNGIENIVEMDYKWSKWISKGFLIFLSFLYGLIPSWGIVLIIFSIVLKIILHPLTHKSFESTSKMQKINPLMKEIQKKYKSDPQTMNAELKKLYKEHGVNPLGGCLPMLLQMPILFALYPILRYSIDLRQASFLWLPDLSEPDPVWALPILMAVFMFVQQKLMAPSKQSLADMDEKQQAAQQSQKMMMYFMPIMMFFIFKGLSSGLVLYWTVFSIIGSVQQYFIKKKFE